MTASEVKAMHDAFSAFKQANEEAVAEVKKFGVKNGLLEEKVETLNLALEELELRINRKGGYGGEALRSRQSEAKTMFLDVLRGKSIPQEELQRKSLIAANDTQGGYLAPLEYVSEIIANVVEFSPIRSVAGVRSTSRMGVQVPKRTTPPAAAWVSETGSRSETTNPAFGLVELRSHELYALTKVSRQEVEDAAFDLEAFLRSEFAEQFGVSEGLSFISGTGNGQPQGILSNSSIDEVVSGHATEIKADALIDAFFSRKEAYAANGTWVMSRTTLRDIRKLKDSQGQYLWSPGIKDAARPATILDRPYLTAVDMPTIGAGTYPVLFGDFRRGYMILDRIAIEFQVDPITSKATGMIEFSARKRVGGMTVLPEALVKVKVAAA